MRTLSQEDDPNEERVQIDGTACMPKRGLIDRIPNINVLPAVREHGVLQPTPEQISVYSLWHRFRWVGGPRTKEGM